MARQIRCAHTRLPPALAGVGTRGGGTGAGAGVRGSERRVKMTTVKTQSDIALKLERERLREKLSNKEFLHSRTMNRQRQRHHETLEAMEGEWREDNADVLARLKELDR